MSSVISDSTQSSMSLPCSPKPIRIYKNYTPTSINCFNFNGNFSSETEPKLKLSYNFEQQRKPIFCIDCSDEEIKEDFILYKQRSENLEVRDEICRILSSGDATIRKIQRPKNPFWKNLEC